MVAALALAAVVMLAFWWLRRDRDVPVAESAPVPVADAEGWVALDPARRTSLGLETRAADAANAIPLTGLPAEAMPPLAASTQAVVPFAGVVTRVLIDEGETVAKGAALARVRSPDFLAAQASVARARAAAGTASRQARRDAELAREGIVPTARGQESGARAAEAGATLRESEGLLAEVRAAKGGVPGEYEVLAPQAGRVLRRDVAPGQSLAAMAPAFLIAEGDAVDVVLTVPMSARDAVKPGLAVRLPGEGNAEVVSVGAATDAGSQGLRVRAKVEGSSPLIAGQHFSATLELPAPAGAVRVPAGAVLPHGERAVVYIEQEGRYRGVLVQRLGGDGESVVVQGQGLAAGMTVVARGGSVLKSLAPVP